MGVRNPVFNPMIGDQWEMPCTNSPYSYIQSVVSVNPRKHGRSEVTVRVSARGESWLCCYGPFQWIWSRRSYNYTKLDEVRP